MSPRKKLPHEAPPHAGQQGERVETQGRWELGEAMTDNSMTKDSISEAFALMAQRAVKLGVRDAHKLAGCWEHEILGVDGDSWWWAINGHEEPVKCSHGTEVPPFHAYLEWCGWPAGVFSPYGGVIVAGDAANEDSFIAALKASTARALAGEGKEG